MKRILALESEAACAIWRVDLRHAPTPDEWALLSGDERTRALRFVFGRDRNRYVSCRSALRQLLAPRCGQSGQGLQFEHGPHGKPFLKAHGPAFNVSHSADVALIAIAEESGTLAVGIDVELYRDVPDAQALAQTTFTPDECAQIADVEDAVRSRTFLTAWTRKEAFLKALGTGLAEATSVSTGIGADRMTVSHRWPTQSGALQPARIDLTTHKLNDGQGIWSLALWRAEPWTDGQRAQARQATETT